MIILQVAHITKIPGPVQSLAHFLKQKTGISCYQILHPLDNSLSYSTLVKKSKKIAKKKRVTLGPVKYFISFFLTLKWLKKLPKKINLAIGMNCFDTLALLTAQKLKLKKIDQIVFFNTDFSRKRFTNTLLNRLYVAIDKFAAKSVDFLCCNTKRTIQARIKEGIGQKKIIYTPNGIFLEKIGPVKKKTYQPQLVYVGRLAAGHDLPQAIRFLKNTKLKLIIIGSGPEENNLKLLVKKQKLEKQVTFLGFMDHQKTINFLKNFSGFGLAPYSKNHDWTYYADPVKIKEYLACLVPPVTNSVVEIAQEIKKRKLGLVYRKSPKKIFQEIASLNNSDYQRLIKNITSYNIFFDYQKIYLSIFSVINREGNE
jgi:glycosyltransferase involved in cell wall biosynthesis